MHQHDDVDPIKMMGDASFTMHVDSTKFRPQNDFMVVFSFSLIFVLFCFASIIEIGWFTSVRSYYSWLLFSPLPKFLAATPGSNSAKNSILVYSFENAIFLASLSERANGNKIVWLSLHLWYVTFIPACDLYPCILYSWTYHA